MRKYLTVFQISWQNEFVYRLNFVLLRLRNVIRLLMTYFLWQGVFLTNQTVFGYNQSQITTYIFLVLAVQALVLSAPSSDNIGSEIGSGDLSNYLVKPLGYLKYWFTRDVASKLLNLLFAVFEVAILFFLFRPVITFPASPLAVIAFLVSAILAMILYYFLSVSARFVAFWTPENTWGLAFVIIVIMETLGGSIFPLDVLPQPVYQLLQLTPFPYLIYLPIAIFSEKIVGLELVWILLQSSLWVIIMYLLTKFIWKKGLVVYQASGR